MTIHKKCAHVDDTTPEQGKVTTTRTGAAAPAGRDTPDGSWADSPFCVVLRVYHLSWYLPQRTLEAL